MPLRRNNFYKEIDKSFIYAYVYFKVFFIKLIKKYKNLLQKAPLFSYYQHYFQPLCPPISPRKKKCFFFNLVPNACEDPEEVKWVNFHPPFFWVLFFLLFLITSTRLWSHYSITKINPPPPISKSWICPCFALMHRWRDQFAWPGNKNWKFLQRENTEKLKL